MKLFKSSFTLLELLIIVAIIGILISILLPSLRLAREKSKIAVCLSNQKQLGVATMLHANDHMNHVALSGQMHMFLNLRGRYKLNQLNLPMPPQVSYSEYLGVNFSDNTNVYESQLMNLEKLQVWECPADNRTNRDALVLKWGEHRSLSAVSYGFNEHITGHDGGNFRLSGSLIKVNSPDRNMLLTDTVSQSLDTNKYNMILNRSFDQTMGWALTEYYNQNRLDLKRHINKQNFLFVDGHAAPYTISRFPNIGISLLD